jgi:hypothetical protein
MKTFLIIFLFGFIGTMASAQKYDSIKEYYVHGKLKAYGVNKNGQKDGEMVWRSIMIL